MTNRILIVEDDSALARVLKDNLVYQGFAVECASDGLQALHHARMLRPDLVLLDVMIPSVDGFEVCRALGGGRDRLPVILLTVKNRREDKVRGLKLGADDYVTKPFAFDELLARIHAVLRRSHRLPKRLTLGDVVVDFGRMRATRDGAPLLLTPREFALLQYLSDREGNCVTRDELLRVVWGYDEVPLTRTVDNFVARLRRKIEPDPHAPRFIRTVHGDGYTFTMSIDG